jgi:hypothetical protein
MPVSLIVTPPWTVMESDGELSEQALGYDHDAQPAGKPIGPPSSPDGAVEAPPQPQAPAPGASPAQPARPADPLVEVSPA